MSNVQTTPSWARPVHRVPLTQAFPALAEVREFKNRVCLFSEDRTRLFDVVSPRYQLVEHGAVVGTMQQVLAKFYGPSAPNFNVRVLNGGARLRAVVQLPIPPLKLASNDVNHLTLVLRNSYDRSCTFDARLGAFRVVCSNGAVVGPQFGAIRARHVGAAADAENLTPLGDSMDSILDQFGAMVARAPLVRELWQGWAETPVARDVAAAMVDKWLPAKYAQPLLDEGRWQTRRTMWQWYNDLTYMSTHLTSSPQRRAEFDDQIAALFYDGGEEDLSALEVVEG